eukprot:8826432-Alexandrium_andersonii.AAC.1
MLLDAEKRSKTLKSDSLPETAAPRDCESPTPDEGRPTSVQAPSTQTHVRHPPIKKVIQKAAV